MVAFNKQQDMVHRVVGPPGIVLVGEGNPHRVKTLLANEERRHARVASEVPIHQVVVGDGEGQVPLTKLVRHVTKLGKSVKGAAAHRPAQPAQGDRRQPPEPADPQGPDADQHEGHARPDEGSLTAVSSRT